MPFPARILEFSGEFLTLDQWSERTGIPSTTIRSRIDKLGWTVEQALTTMVDHRQPATGRQCGSRIAVPPQPKRHKASNRAFVRLPGGKFLYLGPWGSAAAAAAYERFLARWKANPPERRPTTVPGEAMEVLELTVQYMQWVEREFVKGGKPTSEVCNRRVACRILNQLYGDYAVTAFTPKCLEACQRHMIAAGRARTSINIHTWRIVDVFRWGVKEGLVPAPVHQALLTVSPIRRGAGAKESVRVPPVADTVFMATLKHLIEPFNTIARLHRLMGCRSTEVCAMKVGDLDRSRGHEWRYQVRDEIAKKFAHGHIQVYWLGPRCQELLTPLLADKVADAYVFCPRGPKRPTTPLHIRADLYRERVAMACAAAGVEHWHPHQLRHSRATEVLAGYGRHAVKTVIQDTTDAMIDRYADPDEELARRIARESS